MNAAVGNHNRRHEAHYIKILVTMKDIITYVTIYTYVRIWPQSLFEVIKGVRPLMLYNQQATDGSGHTRYVEHSQFECLKMNHQTVGT